MIAFLGGIGWQEILVVLLLVLLLFGGKKLPELARGLGKGMREFKRELGGIKDELEKDEPADTHNASADQTASTKTEQK
jgi:sec-independent protein translocase protein TatA